MRTVYLTDEQFKQLFAILERAKDDAEGWMWEYATSMKEEEAVEEYCKGVDAVIALLQKATNNNQPSTPHMSQGE